MELNIYPLIWQGLINSVGIFWPYYLLLLFLIVIRFVWLMYKQYLLAKAGMPEIDRMTGDEFEQRLGILFEKFGYTVEYVGSHRGDFGADLVIEKARMRTVVQAKRHASYIPERAVQEAVAAIKMYKAHRAMVVTNNYFSRAARALAKANDVELWDRDELARRMVEIYKL
ncbi:restriction endonuclease [Candidatus Woesebacteria bacterium]|nr:restriction endonuclease [Candidatus Woesebacteria bacterium]